MPTEQEKKQQTLNAFERVCRTCVVATGDNGKDDLALIAEGLGITYPEMQDKFPYLLKKGQEPKSSTTKAQDDLAKQMQDNMDKERQALSDSQKKALEEDQKAKEKEAEDQKAKDSSKEEPKKEDHKVPAHK